MPLTFLSHQAPILPLKIAAPRWFDGTALVIGSMAPDLLFVGHGTPWSVDAHLALVPFLLCVPLTVVLTWVVKRFVAGPLGAHLPDAGSFHLRDFGRLAAWTPPRRPAAITVLFASALVGSVSHVVLDSFTHGFGWVVERVPALRVPVVELPAALTGHVVLVHDLLQVAGTVVGAAVTIGCLHLIGRRRLLVAWYPVAPQLTPTAASWRRLVLGGVGGVAAGCVLAAVTSGIGGAEDLVIRVAAVTFAGLLVGCVTARRHMTDVGVGAEPRPA